MARELVRGAGLLRRSRGTPILPRPRTVRDGDLGRRIWLRTERVRGHHRRGRGGRVASGRHSLRRDYRPADRRRAVRGEGNAAVDTLRAISSCASGVRREAVTACGVLSRPRPDRADVVRWRAHTHWRRVASGSHAARTRPRAQTRGCKKVRGVVTRIPQTPVGRTTPRGQSAPPSTSPRPDATSGLSIGVDVDGLASALRQRVRGEVRFNDGDRALYSTDASNYRQIPIGIVLPRDADDVVEAVALCRRYGAPIVSRGGATDLAGSTCNAAVVLDMSKYMNHVLEINWDETWARVEPGTVLDDLRRQAEARHLTFGPDPATHNRNTLGGMIGNNSCGMHAQMAGKVEENTLELEILTYDGLRMWVGPATDDEIEKIVGDGGVRGEIYARLRAIRDRYADEIRKRFPNIPRLVSGYPLQQLLPENGFNVARALVGTESTCVTVLQAKLRLVH